MKSIREAFDEIFTRSSKCWIPEEEITKEYLDRSWQEFANWKGDYLRDPCFPDLESLCNCMNEERVLN